MPRKFPFQPNRCLQTKTHSTAALINCALQIHFLPFSFSYICTYLSSTTIFFLTVFNSLLLYVSSVHTNLASCHLSPLFQLRPTSATTCAPVKTRSTAHDPSIKIMEALHIHQLNFKESSTRKSNSNNKKKSSSLMSGCAVYKFCHVEN